MSTPRKDPIPNQDENFIGLKKDQCLTPDIPPFLPGNKELIKSKSMIILKLKILHNMKNMIHHILNGVILLQM